jgi:hypothetical protein
MFRILPPQSTGHSILTGILAAVDDALEQITPVLLPGEKLLWTGRPDPAVNFTAADAYLVPFYVLWTSFAVFMFFGFRASPSAGFAQAIPVLFIIIGIYFVFGRFLVKAAGKRRTSYAVTNRRALVVRGGYVAESPILDVQKTTRRARNGKHLSVTFGAQPRMGIFGQNASIPNAGLDFFHFGGTAPVAFYDVADVEGLSDAMAEALWVAPNS